MEHAQREYPPHQQRVITEAEELLVKIEALSVFITDNPIFKTIEHDEQGRLLRQLVAMTDYHNILEERIENF